MKFTLKATRTFLSGQTVEIDSEYESREAAEAEIVRRNSQSYFLKAGELDRPVYSIESDETEKSATEPKVVPKTVKIKAES